MQSCDNVAANRYWLLECKDIFTAGNFHIVPGRTHKASAGVAGVVLAGVFSGDQFPLKMMVSLQCVC